MAFYGGLLGAITGALVLCAMFACADDANDDSDGGLTIDEAAELVCWREANAFGWCVRASLPPVAVRSVFVRAGVPGLYEVTFGFFARRKPAIRLLVDGEPVLAAVNSASYVTHHSSGRLTSATRHPAGNVTGLTLIDFLALPAKAKIAVVYEDDALD